MQTASQQIASPRQDQVAPARSTTEPALAHTWNELRRSLNDSLNSPGPFRPAAVGRTNISRLVEALGSASAHRTRRMHVTLAFDPFSAAVSDSEMIVTEFALAHNPLLASQYPDLLIAAVPGTMVLFDSRYVLLEGPHTPHGHPTAWVTHDPGLAAVAASAWERVRAGARACALERLKPRHVSVARHMALGRTTRVIARELGYSERTIERDIDTVVVFVGADSRASAITRLLGAFS